MVLANPRHVSLTKRHLQRTYCLTRHTHTHTCRHVACPFFYRLAAAAHIKFQGMRVNACTPAPTIRRSSIERNFLIQVVLT